MRLQLVIATLLCLAGITLLFMGLWMPPRGEIHSSVLVAFGEVSTFAGALLGVDYKYRSGDKTRGLTFAGLPSPTKTLTMTSLLGRKYLIYIFS